MNIEMIDCFLPLITEKSRYKIYYGGRGGGKSVAFADAFIILMLNEKRDNPVYACFRETQTSLADSVKPLMIDRIARLGLSHMFYWTNTSGDIKCLYNGGKFLFAGLNGTKQVNKIKSMHGLLRIWIEEAHDVLEESWDIITPSVRGDDDAEIWVSFNPNKKTDFIYQHFVTEAPQPDSLVREVNYYDNPFFPEVLDKERQACLKYPSKYNRIWLGKPGFIEHQLLKPEWWRFYDDADDVKNVVTGAFITADTAYKEGTMNDYSVIQLWAYNGIHQLYLIDQIRGKWEFPTLTSRMRDFVQSAMIKCRVRPDRIFIEDKASGISLVQTLSKMSMNAIAWKPRDYAFPDDKVGRVNESSLIVSSGCVYLPRNAPYTQGFIDECGEFGEEGTEGFDDQVDGMTMGVSIWRSRGGGADAYRG